MVSGILAHVVPQRFRGENWRCGRTVYCYSFCSFFVHCPETAFAGMEPAVTSDRSRTQTSLPCPWGGSNTPDTSGNKEYSARDKRRNFRRG
ncbi:hypothetical protein DFS30_00955 [Akkermansia muciniphila]|uniref:Uncharacterized protein n=1 Tax=Akkermansia muciniphila TaxID=239935 RepID=A0AAP8TA44_9BACT|nr:hypothetical protein CUC06_00615 [Akkermansia muciniphila]MBE5700496.1 hypothetical protein [Akkermansia sp.]OLA90330.1 MAG: hypothetical protein BHW66_03080 [Akkermansia sp. 54_46]MBD9262194.1 hypothetical protein [Akkermansia muciniphila]MCO6189893.1 hypothetical protein [Akkermansia muciniphila]